MRHPSTPLRMLLLAVALSVTSIAPPQSAYGAAAPAHITPCIGRAKLASVLIELSLGPESLCVAGVPASDIGAFVEASRADLEARAEDINAAEGRVAAARALLTSLEGRRQPSATPEQLADATAELEAARAAFASLQMELFQTLAQHLTEPQRAAVGHVRANRQWGVPVQYLLIDRSASEWVRLREALASAREARAHQRAIDAAVQTVISGADAEAATATAAQALELHKIECRAAWSQAVGG